MVKKVAYIMAFVLVASALPVFAQRVAAVRANPNHHSDVLQRCGSASGIVFSNFTGPNSHKYNNTTGYFVDGSNFFNQVLGFGFTPTSTVKFADVLMAMAVYTLDGGENNPGNLNVYLESDSGGAPGSLIEGPLSRCQGISNFNDNGGNIVEFDCTSCNTTLTAGTPYWIVAQEATATSELTWDEVRGLTDASSPFAFNQTGNAFGDWLVVGTGYSRSAYTVEQQ
jgi:hypothetical protein